MAKVALRGASKAYPGGVQALDELSLTVQDREFLVLLGPSGCGKSTTLRLIAGLEELTQGEVLIGDTVVNNVSPKDRNIAMVFQNYALYPHMTVYKNMAFGLQLRYGGSWFSRAWKRWTQPAEAARLTERRREIPERIRETARMLGIESLLGRMPRQLSGGERQRVALGRAMVRQPAVFLFDEPLSNLDAKLRLETRRELKQLHGRLQATMIYVTHDQTEALTLGDRIAVLQGGHLQQIGTPEQIYDAPSNQFVAGFVGSPPMNFLAGKLRRAGAQREFVSAAMHLRLAGAANAEESTEVVLGVRPADVSVYRSGAAPGEVAATGTITLIEPLGDDSFVHVELQSDTQEERSMVCRTPPRSPFRCSDSVDLVLDASRIHLFEAAGGQRFKTRGAE